MQTDITIPSHLRPPTSQNRKLRKSIVGQKFNRLTVYGLVGFTKTRQSISHWLCRCKCGNFSIVAKPKLLKGTTKSCGCQNLKELRALSTTHGMSQTRIFRIWVGMQSRCYDPNCESFKDYGARGITICDRWRGSQGFTNFLTDMGQPTTDQHSIDRKENNGNYEPANCKWSDRYEQARNNRHNHYLTAQGETYCASQWAEITGIKSGLILARIRRGWSAEEALKFKERPPRNSRWIKRLSAMHPSPPTPV